MEDNKYINPYNEDNQDEELLNEELTNEQKLEYLSEQIEKVNQKVKKMTMDHKDDSNNVE